MLDRHPTLQCPVHAYVAQANAPRAPVRQTIAYLPSFPNFSFGGNSILSPRHLQLLLRSRKLLIRRQIDDHQVEQILKPYISMTVIACMTTKRLTLFIFLPFFRPLPFLPRFPRPSDASPFLSTLLDGLILPPENSVSQEPWKAG